MSLALGPHQELDLPIQTPAEISDGLYQVLSPCCLLLHPLWCLGKAHIQLYILLAIFRAFIPSLMLILSPDSCIVLLHLQI